MTMNEPNFASFLNSFYDSASGIISANAATNYIITPQKMKGNAMLNTLTNALTAFSRPIGETLCVMENDLAGLYNSDRKQEYAPLLPYIHDGRFHFRNMEADRMLMIPLLMDFSQDRKILDDIYYPYNAEDKITPYAEDTIAGIKEYYRQHPDGLFEFYPFIGIDPRLHSLQFMESLFDKYVNTSHRFHAPHEIPDKPCYGIKLYPPLGFKPWPNDRETLDKHRWLYSFCERNRIPIITHSDDQGFRGTSAEEAWANTDPASWRTVLENYPSLIIDFAHFGKQYAIATRSNMQSIAAKLKKHPDSPWFYSIISLMMDFDNVYADVSFSGCNQDFYTELCNYLKDQKESSRERIMDRILFGSDFSVNLLKVESYTEYFSVFENSEFSDSDAERIAETNPLRFLALEEPSSPLRGRNPIGSPERSGKVRRTIKPRSV